MIKNDISEKEMVDAFMASNRFKTSRLLAEVPIYSRCVDLVVYNQKKKQITAIEFKKTKWKAAIDQVLKVSTCFDYLEICILEPAREDSRNNIKEICRKMGIGLYLFNPIKKTVKKVVSPMKIQSLWKRQKQDAIIYLDGRLDS